MEDIYKLIDDINLQKLDNLDTRVNDALSSPKDDALFILGETLYNYGLMPQGLEVFRTLYHKYPDESELLIYFIEGLMSENHTDEALEYLSEVEMSTERLMLEADLYQQLNMLEVAISKLDEAIDIEPNDPIIHYALAELLYYDGQYLRATSEYETVLETGEYEVNGVNLFSRLADCSLQSGNYSDAIKMFDEISEDEWIMQHQNNENTDAQDQLVRHYRKLIESLAYKYSKGQSHHEDLVQVGMVGLIGAINRFDLSFDRKFEAFLVPTVIGEIKRYLRDKTWSVHVPRRIKEIGPRIKKVTDELTNELERSPSITEIADRLEVNEEDVLEAMEMGQSYNALSVDHSIEADKDGSTVTLLDIMGQQDDNYDLTEKRMILEKILPILSERERQIIQCTFIEGLSQKETGERIGLSQMHVSRLQRTAIKKLQEAANK